MTNYIDQAQIAEAIKCAIDLDHADVVAILAAHVQATVCEITTADGKPEELSDNGALWVNSAHSLVIEGVTVAEWSRCSVGSYDSDGDWHVEEDTGGDDTLPHIVYDLIAAIGLDDHTPDVPERSVARPDGLRIFGELKMQLTTEISPTQLSKRKTIMTIKVRIDGENNADLFWANLEEQMPILAQQLRDDSFTQLGETTIDEEQWEVVQEIEGFADGPAYARTALIRVE